MSVEEASAAALIQPQAQKLLYAAGAAVKRKEMKKKSKESSMIGTFTAAPFKFLIRTMT